MKGLTNKEITNTLSNGTAPDPLRPPVPQDWGSQTLPQNPKLRSLLSQERVKLVATDFKFRWNIHRVHPLKILVKRERGRIQGLPKFLGHPQLSLERAKLRASHFVCMHIHICNTLYCVWGGWALTESLTLYYQPLHLTSFIFIVLLLLFYLYSDVNKILDSTWQFGILQT